MTNPSGRGLSEQQRAEILDQKLVAMAGNGGRVATRTGSQAVVITGKPVNHVLHVLLSLFCCGWWVPVWLFVTALGGEKRTTVSVAADGRVSEVKSPMAPHQIILLVIGAVWLLGWVVFFGIFVSSFGSQ